METETVHAPLTWPPTLASSWDAACGALAQTLRLTRAGLGAGDADWEELLAPSAAGQDLVILKRNLKGQDENPCFLYLRCDPHGGEEIVSIGILSSARNMEVYLGEEYCGTSRGKNVCNGLDNSEHEKITLYKKYLKLESPTHACKIKNCVALGEQLQSILGNAGHRHVQGLQSSSAPGAFDKSSSTPFPFRTGLTSGNVTEDSEANTEKSLQPAGGGSLSSLQECKIVPQSRSLLENDLKNAVSSLLSKKASDSSHIPNSELLPLLQNLCGQVSHLRVGPGIKWQDSIPKPGGGTGGVTLEEQSICSYLEKILSKNMELMEKKLTDYIDQRIYKLQEHIDNKIALLMDLLQRPNSPPSGMPLRHYDSGEGLSNGER
ncbi:ATPase PAAT isoform 2-T2 [Dama dama]|uniref:ATPase PAAT isoform X2 n=1 Tax=Dama dama TaxID=30532 RepID=UPI002A36E10E|nr:ATPase PAAT isoform X2 [Dama dama]